MFKKSLFILLQLTCLFSFGQTSTLVAINENEKLIYSPDIKGNTIPYFSGVGYLNSDSSIPFVPTLITVDSVIGDNTSNIQNAINNLASYPIQSSGFRGAILFKDGYKICQEFFKI